MVRHGKKDGSRAKQNQPTADKAEGTKKKRKRAQPEGKNAKKPKTGYKRGSLAKAIYEYMDKVTYPKVTYDMMLKVALKAKPNTKFNHSHYCWYRNKYRAMHNIKK